MLWLYSLLMDLHPTVLMIVLAFGIFAIVWILSLLGFLENGYYQRIGVLVATYLLSGVLPEDAEKAITTLVMGVIAVVMNEFKEFLAAKKVASEE